MAEGVPEREVDRLPDEAVGAASGTIPADWRKRY